MFVSMCVRAVAKLVSHHRRNHHFPERKNEQRHTPTHIHTSTYTYKYIRLCTLSAPTQCLHYVWVHKALGCAASSICGRSACCLPRFAASLTP